MAEVKVRSKGPDVLFRYAGRRCRIGSDWTEISADALERCPEADLYRIEVEGQDGEVLVYGEAKPDLASSPAPRGDVGTPPVPTVNPNAGSGDGNSPSDPEPDKPPKRGRKKE